MSELKGGALISYAATALSLLLGLLYTPWIVRTIGADDYGLYTLAISVTAMATTDFGINAAISRFLSIYHERGETEKADAFVATAYCVYIALSLVTAVVLIMVFLFIDRIYSNLPIEQINTLKSLYVIVSAYSVVSIPFMSQNSILLANEKLIILKSCDLFQKIITVALTILALLLGLGVRSLVLMNALAGLLFILVKAVIIVKKTSIRVHLSLFNRTVARRLVGFSGWVMASQVSQRFNLMLPPAILGALSGSFEVALFGLANQLQGYVYTLASSISGIVMPKVTQAITAEHGANALTDLMIRIGRILLLIIGVAFVGFACFGQSFVALWVGSDYETLWGCVMAVLLVYLLSLPQQVGDVAILISNHVRYSAVVEMFCCVVTISLVFLSGVHVGAFGAWCSIAIGVLLYRLLIMHLLKKRVGVDILRFLLAVYPKWICCSLASMPVGLLTFVLPQDSWLFFGLEVLILCVVYFGVCWAFYMNDHEKGLLSSWLHRRRGSEYRTGFIR